MKPHSAPVLLAAACVLLLVGGTWWALGRGSSSVPAVETPALGAIAAATSEPTEPARLPVPQTAASAPARDLARDGVEVGPESAAGALADVLVLLDGAPAADADVYALGVEQLRDPRLLADFEELGLGLELLARHARAVRTDARGIATVRCSEGPLQVVAVREEHFGMRTLERWSAADGPIRVDLELAQEVLVLVRDAGTRQPVAGVGVLVRHAAGRDAAIGARTGADGRARLWPVLDDPRVPGRWHASVPGVFREPVAVPFTLGPAPEQLELSLPPSGPASVHLVDAGRRPCPLTGVMEVGWNDSEGDPAESNELAILDGVVRLPRVEHGLQVHVRASRLGLSRSVEGAFTIDAERPESARVELVIEMTVVLVRARLLGEDGEPLRFTRVVCEASVPGLDEAQATTDGEGRMVLPLGADPAEGTSTTLVLEAKGRGGERQGCLARAEVVGGSVELGDLRLASAQTVISGKVVDAQGAALAGVSVWLTGRGSGGTEALARAARAESDAEGRFELRGWAEPGELALHAFHGGRHASARGPRGGEVELRFPRSSH